MNCVCTAEALALTQMCSCCCHMDRVKGRVDGKIVPIPPGQDTVNTLFDANVHSEEEMEVRRWQEPMRFL